MTVRHRVEHDPVVALPVDDRRQGQPASLLFDALTDRASRPSSKAPRVIPARLVPSDAVCTASRTSELLTARPKKRQTMARQAAPQSISSSW